MQDLDTREWLLTNGLGSFACGTVCDAATRTYHGWLVAALEPPLRRTLLLSHIEATLEVAEQVFPLGANFWIDGTIAPRGDQLLRCFDTEPVPTWTWGLQNWELTRQLVMPHGFGNQENASPEPCHRLLIKYRYVGRVPGKLRLRPLIAERDFHQQQFAEPDLHFSQLLGEGQVRLQAIRGEVPGTPWHLRWSAGDYEINGFWYFNYHYPEETKRGLCDREDLYSPGELTVSLKPGGYLILEARVEWSKPGQEGRNINLPPTTYHLPFPHSESAQKSKLKFDAVVSAERQRLTDLFGQLTASPTAERAEVAEGEREAIWQQLLRAGDQFIAYRASIDGPTVIAGYPWFNDWGRDTLIALPGLALATQRFGLAKGLLQTFGRYCQQGLIPNTFPDAGAEPFYNSIDAALWWVETLGLYLEATQDWDFLQEAYPVVRQIYQAYADGTRYNIRVDPEDGLLIWDADGVALTWMDAVIDGVPVTPRRGKPVEINALWYSALCWAAKWAEGLGKRSKQRAYKKEKEIIARQSRLVKASLKKFWNAELGYFYDTISPDGRPDPRIRPNAVLALSLHHCGFLKKQGRQVLQVARARLLTPFGLRSLATDDPEYVGSYAGDRQHRDRTYHQGTVWSWLIGPFIRAWQRFYPSEPVGFDWQPLQDHFYRQGCVGSVSEIFDGDEPHLPQGAFAQAWSVAELIRHWPR